MRKQITNKIEWVAMDGSNGTTFVPAYDFSDRVIRSIRLGRWDAYLGNFYEGKIQSVEIREGFGARMSEPGYMDCTEWGVFATHDEADAYLDEMYGEEDQ